MSEAIKSYYAALERLKQNKPKNVKKDTAINKDTVALEAGKKRGSIRNRSGFEDLIADIRVAAEGCKKRSHRRDDSDRLKDAQKQIQMLKKENDILKSRYMSLLFLNYEFVTQMRKAGLDTPSFGQAVNFEVKSKLPV